MLPREEREDRSRMSDLVAVIQVVGPRIIKVDRLLDEAQPERTGVEVEIAVGPSRDSGHVMDARHGHSLLQHNDDCWSSIAMQPIWVAAAPAGRTRWDVDAGAGPSSPAAANGS